MFGFLAFVIILQYKLATLHDFSVLSSNWKCIVGKRGKMGSREKIRTINKDQFRQHEGRLIILPLLRTKVKFKDNTETRWCR